jgi:hypothetical protein
MFCLLGIVFCCFAKTSDCLIGDAVEPNPISARGQSEFAMLLERAGSGGGSPMLLLPSNRMKLSLNPLVAPSRFAPASHFHL